MWPCALKKKTRKEERIKTLHTSLARFYKRNNNNFFFKKAAAITFRALGQGEREGKARGWGEGKKLKGVRISGWDWSCLTLPAEPQRDREMRGMGLPILFLERGIEPRPDPQLWTLSRVIDRQTDMDTNAHTHAAPFSFGHYTLWAKWWLSALIVFAGDWCPERSFLTADWARAGKRWGGCDSNTRRETKKESLPPEKEKKESHQNQRCSYWTTTTASRRTHYCSRRWKETALLFYCA